ncbi:MAG: hypothetical protein ACFB6S_14670 [Geminicoccaceae bacterium]
MIWRSLIAVSLVALTGCSASWGDNNLAGYDRLGLTVKRHYQRFAHEEQRRCVRPEIRSIVKTEVIEDTEDQITLDLRYSYRDESFEDTIGFGDNKRRRAIQFTCRGFNERTFIVAKTEDGFEVEFMEGPQRQNPPRDWSRVPERQELPESDERSGSEGL